MLTTIQISPRNLRYIAQWTLFLVLALLETYTQPCILKPQEVPDGLERSNRPGPATQGTNALSSLVGSWPGSNPFFPAVPRSTGGPVGLAPVTESPRAKSKPEGARRTPFLIGLYATQAALEGLDARTTLRALQAGKGREGNPVLSPFASSPPALIAFKMGSTAGILATLDRIHKYHARSATIACIAINVGYAFVVAHNFRIITATPPNR